jgi:hypothetical protein
VTDEKPHLTPFTGWQWFEIWALIALVVAQLAVQILLGNQLIGAMIGFVILALLIHTFRWMLPVVRFANSRRHR